MSELLHHRLPDDLLLAIIRRMPFTTCLAVREMDERMRVLVEMVHKPVDMDGFHRGTWFTGSTIAYTVNGRVRYPSSVCGTAEHSFVIAPTSPSNVFGMPRMSSSSLYIWGGSNDYGDRKSVV